MTARLAALLVLVAAAGCTTSGPQPGASTPTPTSTGQVIGTLDMAVRTSFGCALPIDVQTGGDARIALPAGTVTLDLPAQTGPGIYGHAYRRGRWLAVPDRWIAPDGKSYAYPTFTSGAPTQPTVTTIHLHDLDGAGDRQLWQGTLGGSVLGWGPGGLYFRVSSLPPPNANGPGPAELWVVDPARPSAAHRVGPNPQPQSGLPDFGGSVVVGAGGAWVTAQDQPSTTVKRGANLLLRMDLREGTVSTWYATDPTHAIAIAGTDAGGRPVLSVVPLLPAGGRPTPTVLLLTGANQATTIGTDSGLLNAMAYGDGHGVWITSLGSIWLYADGQLRKLASVPAGLFPGPPPKPGGPFPPILQVVGPCA